VPIIIWKFVYKTKVSTCTFHKSDLLT
jgi:hypothetical protein